MKAIALAMFSLALVAQPSFCQSYKLTDLGALIGTNSYAQGINDGGQVVGYWETANGAYAFLYHNGAVTNLGLLGDQGVNNYALSINNYGQVVGFSTTTNGAVAFVYEQGTNTNLGTFGGLGSYAFGINDGGQIVGYVATDGGATAFLLNNGVATSLGTLGGTNSFAYGVNNGLQVAGASLLADEQTTHAFLWQNDVMSDLNQLMPQNSGWQLTEAHGINDNGSVAGWGMTNGQQHAFLYLGSGLALDLGTLPGGTNSYALGVNSSNQVVGASSCTSGNHAVLWQNGTAGDLNQLASQKGWVLSEATGINDLGQITGWGITNGQVRAFVLWPSSTVLAVTLTAPTNNTVVRYGSNVTLNASAASVEGVITKVQFYQGNSLLATATNAPYAATWTKPAAGTYALTARATDNFGLVSTSSVIALTVDVPPSVTLTNPANNAVVAPGTAVTLGAAATSTNGLSQVQFYQGRNLLGAATSAPYSLVWSSLAAGTNLLSAVAVDNFGLATTSSVVSVLVDQWPSVALTSPTNSMVVRYGSNISLAANATSGDATITKVQFYQSNSVLATVTNAPYAATWTKPAAGVYALTARATDNYGLVTTSAVVSVTVDTPPSVTLTNPANNAVVALGTAVTLGATATSTNGLSQVQFYQGRNLLGAATSAPYSLVWSSLAAGTNLLSAVAVDNFGLATTSSVVSVLVDQWPSVALTSPTNSMVVRYGSNISLAANATSGDATITKVQFYQSNSVLATVTNAPYAATWTKPAAGVYALTARATDNYGLVTTSAVVSVTVDTPPSVTLTNPANNAVVAPGTAVTLGATATSTNGLSQVQFYQGSNLLGAATSAPYSLVWSSLAAGTNLLSAVAVDNFGLATTSSVVSVLVDQWPSVALTSPTNSMVVRYGSNISLAANATSGDATITKVQFYQSNSVLATVTNAPYAATWTKPAAGVYALTARATDNYGLVTTSAVVSVTVDTAPSVTLTNPANNAVIAPRTVVTLGATATSTNGLSQVQFYQGSNLLGGATSAPYGLVWSSVAAGTNLLSAVAVDNLGLATTSSVVSVLVDAPPGVFLTNPANDTVTGAGSNVNVAASALAAGGGMIAKVQFFQGSSLVATATNAPYAAVWSKPAAGAYAVTARATDGFGLISTSAPVSVFVVKAYGSPVIIAQPANQTIIAGANATFDVVVSPSSATPLRCQWYCNSNQLVGATNLTLALSDVQPVNAGSYSVMVSNALGGATSSNATLTVVVPPTIVTQPTNQALPQGSNAIFSVTAAGTAPLVYQWYFDGTPLTGSTNSVLEVMNVQPAAAGNYSVLVANVAGSVTSTNAILALWGPPTISTQPLGQTVVQGSSVTFTVLANGSKPMSYQWQFNGTNLPASTIKTVVGNGSAAYSGDGGPATNACLNSPSDVVIDMLGNRYIADVGNNVVRKVDTNGIITTVAGNGSWGYDGDNGMATNASFSDPTSVAVDKFGDVFIADSGNNVIRKVDTSGVITTVVGNGNAAYAGDGGVATNASLNWPQSVTVDAYGDLFIADSGNNVIREVDTNGVITTVAGNGNPDYTGDGGLATSASLSSPSSSVRDAFGNLFIADTGNNVIRELETNGIITTVAGTGDGGYDGDGGAATNAILSGPAGLTFDKLGNLYIADAANNVIREVDTNGIISTVAGNGVAGYTGDNGLAVDASLSMPCGVALDSSGNLLIADLANNVIRSTGAEQATLVLCNATTNDTGSYDVVVENPNGVVTSVGATLTVLVPPQITSQPASEVVNQGSFATFSVDAIGTAPLSYQWYFNGAQLAGAVSSVLVVSNVQSASAGSYSVAVANIAGSATSTNAVLSVVIPPSVVTQSGSQTVEQGSNAVFTVVVDGTGPLNCQWLFDGTNLAAPIITTVAGDGTNGYGGDGGPATNASLNGPVDLAMDSDGNAFVADSGNNVVRKITAGGFITTVAGNGGEGYIGDGGAATNATLNGPQGVAADMAGNLFVADTGNNVIREITTEGIIVTVAGNGTTGYTGDGGAATNASLSGPSGVAVDANGNLFVADTYNNVIREINTDGVITTVAGNGIWDYVGDGGGATNASFSGPSGVAIDAYGNLFIADGGNSVIREVNTNGIITTVAGNGAWGYAGDGGAAINASLNNPFGVAVDAFGNLLVADTENNVIREVTAGGIIVTVAGDGNAGYTGDGGPATSAALTNPSGVAADPYGNFFIADTGNSVIRTVQSEFGGQYSSQLSLRNVTAGNTGDYSLIVCNAAGCVTVSNMLLSVMTPPVIVMQPASVLAIQGGTESFSVIATGAASLSYQWYFNGTQLTSATNSTLTVSNIQSTNAGNYSVAVVSIAGSVISSNASLTVWVPPTIITQSSNQNAVQGSTVTFSVAVGGSGPFSYQWLCNGTNLPPIITTVAGNGSAAYSGDGGQGCAASLNTPSNVAVDVYGDLFIADTANNVVREVNTNGIIVTVAGNGSAGYGGDGSAATNASLNGPSGVAVDVYGDLFIADTANNVVREVNTNGIIVTVAGNGSAGYGGDGSAATNASLNGPSGVAVDLYGDLFVADTANNVIREINTNGFITTVVGDGIFDYAGDGGAATNASLSGPSGVAVDLYGDLFVADTANNVVREVNTNGVITTVAGDGSAGYTGDGGAATNASLSGPLGVAVDVYGDLFVADTANNVVREVNTNGVITTVAGDGSAGYTGDGGAATNASLNGPSGVAVDVDGNLFLADTVNNAIRAVSATSFTGPSGCTLTLYNVNGSSAGDYSVIICNPNGCETNSGALLTVVAPPVIIAQPANYLALQGSNAAFSVTATSVLPLSYQWYFNSTNLLIGATNVFLTVVNVQTTNEGNYSVAVSNQMGSVTSSAALLTIRPSMPQTLGVGGERIMELTANGDVVSWGGNLYGELGDYTHIDSTNPVHVVGLTNVVKIACSLNYALAIDANGSLWSWGELDQLNQTNIPVQVPGMTNVIAIAAYGQGFNDLSGGGGGGSMNTSTESNLWAMANSGQAVAGSDPAVAVKSDGTVWMWGASECDDYGVTPMQITGLSNVVAVAAGNCQTFALMVNGTVWTWGKGNETPVLVSGVSNITAICAGSLHTLALASNGVVWAWGLNEQGQLGDGGQESQSDAPVMVTGLTNIVAIAAGKELSVALDTLGNVWFWGSSYDYLDQMSLGSYIPVEVGLTNCVAIGAGSSAFVAVDGNGNLWQWGASDSDEDIVWQWGDVNGQAVLSTPYTDFYQGQPPKLTIIKGNNQATYGGLEFAQPMVFQVTDANGNTLRNAPVSVEIISGDMELRTVSGGANSKGLRLTTDASGLVSLIGYADQQVVNTACLVRVLAASRAQIVEADFNETLSLPPTVSITSPNNGANCLLGVGQPLAITVAAQAATNASISEVVYSYGTNGVADTPLGVSTASPFSFVWTNALWWSNAFVGQYTVQAVAVDNGGGPSQPASVNFSVALDSTGSGLPDYWQLEYFGEIGLNSSSSPDGNGQSLLYDYQNGFDPTDFYDGLYYDGFLPTLEMIGGNDQFGSCNSFLPVPITVKVWKNSPQIWLVDAPIVFSTTNGAALLAATTNDVPASSVTLRSDTNGNVSAWVYFPAASSSSPESTICASAVSDGASTNVIFTEYVPLAHWTFDDTNTWVGTAGQWPVIATNVVGVPDWSSNAVLVDCASPATLAYNVVEADGTTNLNCQTGSAMFWFMPNWSSADQGGSGPGTFGRLMEIGNYNPAFTNGWWSLYFNPDGTKIFFGTSTNGAGMTNLSAKASWTAGEWYQIALTYSPAGSALYVDGRRVGTGTGVTCWPNAEEQASGFTIGSDQNGQNQAEGEFDELATFNYPLTAGQTCTWGNDLPDWWQLYWFGNLKQTGAETDQSVNGNSLASDCTFGWAPVVFQFNSIYETNNYSRVSLIPVQLMVAGSPYYQAVLVDDTNLADAVWTTYNTSNLLVNMGLTPGWHEAWIGLRGHADDPTNAVWKTIWLNLDQTPYLVVTNPTPSMTVSTPWLQLQGYASVPLFNLTYDLANASGIITNQPAFLAGLMFDTNVWAPTTQQFQGYDVQLAPGLNQITLHAVDVAGNELTTNVSVILDYSQAVPPVLTSVWPAPGMAICGGQFNFEGLVNDTTAGITAQIVDGSGNTNVLAGWVERNGTVWVNNLPLGPGVNTLTVTATNAAGQASSITESVTQSDVTATVTPLTPDQMNQPSVTVYGTVSDASLQVYVNGVAASIIPDEGDDGGTWEADNVPVQVPGTAVFDVEIYGEPVAAISQVARKAIRLAAQTPLTATPPTPVGSTLTAQAAAPTVQVVQYVEQDGGISWDNIWGNYVEGYNMIFNFNNSWEWTEGVGGTYYHYANVTIIVNTIVDPPNTPFGPYSETESLAPEGLWWMEEGMIGGYAWSGTVSAKTALKTGGTYVPGQVNLYLVKVQVQDANGNPIPASQVQVPGYTLSPDASDPTWGDYLVSAPGQATVQMTPTAPLGYYSFQFQVEEITNILAVDNNRDGQIKFDGSDDTSASNPYRFWIDDSQENGDIVAGSEAQIPGGSNPNCLRDHPNGRSDYVNFFPVALQMTNILQWFSITNGFEYHLSQADRAVKLIYTDLTPTLAFDYLTNAAGSCDYGMIDWTIDQYGAMPFGYTTLDKASSVVVGAKGMTLNSNWLSRVQINGGTGIILLEGTATTTQPLMLEVWYKDQSGVKQKAGSVPLYLAIDGVERMYRQLNLRVGTPPDSALVGNLARRNQDPGLTTQMNQPSNSRDFNLNGGWFIFIVGSNVDGSNARGWESEVFKRLYWSGSKAKFVGVSWYGDPYLNNEGIYDYHMAVRNAFATAPALAAWANGLNGSKTIAGHSLSCLIIASAIAQQGMKVNHACLIDAAFAQECFDGAVDDNLPAMRPSAWTGYPEDLFAAHWHEQFDSSDKRSTLTWRNEFLGAVHNIYSFYSSTEDCLATTYSDVPGNSGTSFGNALRALVNDNGNTHNYVWEYQEKAKGARQYYCVPFIIGSFHAGSTYGGWGFNLMDPLLVTDPVWYEVVIPGNSPSIRCVKTPGEIGTVSANLLSESRWTPLFKTGWGRWVDAATVLVDTSPAYYTGPSWIFSLYARNSTGSMVAADPVQRAQLLAEAIPALSLPVGANHCTQVLSSRQFNMAVLFTDQKDWPRGINNQSIPNWYHSDLDQVAYPFLFKLYNQLVSISNQ